MWIQIGTQEVSIYFLGNNIDTLREMTIQLGYNLRLELGDDSRNNFNLTTHYNLLHFQSV